MSDIRVVETKGGNYAVTKQKNNNQYEIKKIMFSTDPNKKKPPLSPSSKPFNKHRIQNRPYTCDPLDPPITGVSGT